MFVDMWRELATDLAMPAPLARTTVNRALNLIYDLQMWSFQVQEAGWLTAGLKLPTNTSGPGQSIGRITPAAYSAQVVGDAAATAAWATLSGRPLLTELQIRSPFYSLYSIVAYDDGTDPNNSPNYPYATLTLDRPWMEPGGIQGYMLYQAYFAAPVADFKRFLDVKDATNAQPVDFWTLGRKDLTMIDPQRTRFDNTTNVISYKIDSRPGSATLGSPLFELWPHPLSVLPYSFTYLRRGPQLALATDVLPAPLNEELVLWRAKELGYLWKESQRGEGLQRGSGANWQFLAGEARENFKEKLKVAKDEDRDLMPDLYFTRMDPRRNGDGFATINGQLNIGRF